MTQRKSAKRESELRIIEPNLRTAKQSQEIAIHADERKWVKDSTCEPFRWMCSLKVEFAEPVIYALGTLEYPGRHWLDFQPFLQGCGSGLLVTPNHVLTAAHVLTGLKLVKEAKTGEKRFRVVKANKVMVIPGRNDRDGKNPCPFGVLESRQLYISPEYAKGMGTKLGKMTKRHIRSVLPYDYGVVEVLPRSDRRSLPSMLPGQRVSAWCEHPDYFIEPVEKISSWKLKQTKVNIAGYPNEKSAVPCGSLWHSFDRVVDAFPKINGKVLDLLLYQADTSEGMSGSPVWIKWEDGRRYLVGIHSSFFYLSDKNTGQKVTANVAALITCRMMAQWQKWVKVMGRQARGTPERV